MKAGNALIVGNSDGIGLELTRLLLERGWSVVGVSRSAGRILHERYAHHLLDVRDADYSERLASALAGVSDEPAVCVYCAGAGEFLDFECMAKELTAIETNLVGAVATAAVVISRMIKAGRGHFIGLSSQADRLVSQEAPSYAASKAGLSSYLEGLALACRPRGVYVTNLRLGFVDTKLAKAPVRPFIVTPVVAAERVLRCIERRPVRDTFPKRLAVLLGVVRALGFLRRFTVRAP